MNARMLLREHGADGAAGLKCGLATLENHGIETLRSGGAGDHGADVEFAVRGGEDDARDGKRAPFREDVQHSAPVGLGKPGGGVAVTGCAASPAGATLLLLGPTAEEAAGDDEHENQGR